MLKVSNDQEITQSEKKSHYENRGGKNYFAIGIIANANVDSDLQLLFTFFMYTK